MSLQCYATALNVASPLRLAHPSENYGSVLRDTSTTLSFNPRSSKAYYRASCALEALGRYAEALDVCIRCLAFDPENASILTQQQKVLKQKQVVDRAEAEKAERLRKEAQEKRVMNACFQVSVYTQRRETSVRLTMNGCTPVTEFSRHKHRDAEPARPVGTSFRS